MVKNANLETFEGDSSVIFGNLSAAPLVAILLCTFKGAQFLAEQLDPLENSPIKIRLLLQAMMAPPMSP